MEEGPLIKVCEAEKYNYKTASHHSEKEPCYHVFAYGQDQTCFDKAGHNTSRCLDFIWALPSVAKTITLIVASFKCLKSDNSICIRCYVLNVQ